MTGHCVITGVGVVAPTGIGAAAHWKNTLDRRSGIRPLPQDVRGESRIRAAGQVEDFRPENFVPAQVRVQTDRWTWLGMAAAELALDDATLPRPETDLSRVSVLTAASSGGNEYGQREIQALWSKGPRAVSVYQSIAWFYAALSGQISIRHGLTGRCGVTVAETAGGLLTAATGLRLLRRGAADHVLIGGAEAPLSPFAAVCQSSMDTLSTTGRYLPFTEQADGGVIGEGAAMLVLERAGTADGRSGQPYAELAAVAGGHDAHHPTAPPPDATPLAAAISTALARAEVSPAQIDVVFADGSGDPRWDRLEADALWTVFRRPVTVALPKTLTGRLNSAAAVVDLSWAALALHHDVIPPSAEGAAALSWDDRLDVVDGARPDTGLRTALVIARGAGGFNAAAVLKATGNR